MKYSYRYFENVNCEYFPCHEDAEELNCLFCYCPLYEKEACPGNPSFAVSNGKRIKDCSRCTFPHEPGNYEKVLNCLKR